MVKIFIIKRADIWSVLDSYMHPENVDSKEINDFDCEIFKKEYLEGRPLTFFTSTELKDAFYRNFADKYPELKDLELHLQWTEKNELFCLLTSPEGFIEVSKIPHRSSYFA